MDGATASYVQRLSSAFYSGIRESLAEFKKAFAPGSVGQVGSRLRTSLLAWLDGEVTQFGKRVERHVFSPSTPLDVVASSVTATRGQYAARLAKEDGVDVAHLIDGVLRCSLERTVTTAGTEISYS